MRPTMSSSTARLARPTALAIPRARSCRGPPPRACAGRAGSRPPTASGSSCSRSLPTRPRIRRPPSAETGLERTASEIDSRTSPRRALEHLERHVAGEPVGDHHVGAARRGGRSPPRCPRSRARPPPRCARVRRDHGGGALAGLLAHGQDAHARAPVAVDGLHEARAHVGELHQVLGAGLHARAGVEQQHGAAGDRQQDGQGRAVHAAQALDLQRGGGERRAGAAGRDERVGAAVGHRACRLDYRCVGLRADGLRRFLVAADRDGASTTSTWPPSSPSVARGRTTAPSARRGALPRRRRPAPGRRRSRRPRSRGQESSSTASGRRTTTSRPAYVPQLGHTRCGRRGSWQRGQWRRCGCSILCCERRLLVRECDCLCLGTAIGRGSLAGGQSRRNSRRAAQRGSGSVS